MKIVIGSVPKDGGTFTFFNNLSKTLSNSGITLYSLSIGCDEAKLVDPRFLGENTILLATTESKIALQAESFVNWCILENVDIVVALNSIAILSALPHLPERIRVVSRCANAFDHGYRITVSALDRLYRIIALAPVQIEDLANDYGVDQSMIELIPNGTDPDRFLAAASNSRGSIPEVRLGFMGRLEHIQKGVLYLPDLLNALEKNAVEFTLKIAGRGVHEAMLRKRLKPFIDSGKVTFEGSLAPDRIPGFLSEIDIFIFPSHFEGSPNALIEAIMAGCVPAAWDIEGLIDFVVKDGETGVLAPVGDVESLAQGITRLHQNRDLLVQFSQAARSDAVERFSVERMASQYRNVFESVMAQPLISYDPLPWEQFRVDPAFAQPWWRRAIPLWIKDVLRPFKRWIMAHRSV